MKTKIIYKFADGTISEVKVEEEVGQAIIISRREEENYERKMRYHCPVSIDRLEYEGMQFVAPDTPMSILEKEIKEEQQKALNDYVLTFKGSLAKGFESTISSVINLALKLIDNDNLYSRCNLCITKNQYI